MFDIFLLSLNIASVNDVFVNIINYEYFLFYFKDLIFANNYISFFSDYVLEKI